MLEEVKNLAKITLSNKIRNNGESKYAHVQKVERLLIEQGITDIEIHTLLYVTHLMEENGVGDFGEKVLAQARSYINMSHNKSTSIDLENNPLPILLETFLSLAAEPNVAIVRMADKAENIKSAHVFAPEESRRMALSALNIYAPIAKILGLGGLSRILQDEAFKILDPQNFHILDSEIKDAELGVKKQLEETGAFLTSIAEEQEINTEVAMRVKGVFSAYSKMVKKDYLHVTSLSDLFAMRVIVDKIEDCYAVETLLNSLLDVFEGEQRNDYIQKPKPGGYKSIHSYYKLDTGGVFEVQIRTKEMHEWNEFGQAAHFWYKYKDFKKRYSQDPSILEELNFFKAQGKIKVGRFGKQVYVFTPKNDIVELDKGATALDFAFALHADLGLRATGAHVNGKYVPLDHVLSTGDRVLIEKSNSTKVPGSKKINMVTTKKARSYIKKLLRANLK